MHFHAYSMLVIASISQDKRAITVHAFAPTPSNANTNERAPTIVQYLSLLTMQIAYKKYSPLPCRPAGTARR